MRTYDLPSPMFIRDDVDHDMLREDFQEAMYFNLCEAFKSKSVPLDACSSYCSI